MDGVQFLVYWHSCGFVKALSFLLASLEKETLANALSEALQPDFLQQPEVATTDTDPHQQQQLSQQPGQGFYASQVPVTSATPYTATPVNPAVQLQVASPPQPDMVYPNPASVQSQFSEAAQLSPALTEVLSVQASPANEADAIQQPQQQLINVPYSQLTTGAKRKQQASEVWLQ